MITKKDKLIKKGIKKLFGLTKTKLRLAEEADTTKTKPSPLPLVKILSGKKIVTIEKAKGYREKLKEQVNYEDKKNLANTVLQLLDIIEGVKYKFEPPECLSQLTQEELKNLEGKKVNLLLMTKKTSEGVNLFIGENPPKNTIPVSVVPSSIAPFLTFAFQSGYFFKEGKLKNITSVLGRKTLLINVIHFALGEFGAELKEE